MRPVNKGRRLELKKTKYKKRLSKMRLHGDGINVNVILHNPKGQTSNGVTYNFTGFKNSSKSCSCSMCSPAKYDRVIKHKNRDLDLEN